MLFNSYSFMFAFLPLVLALFFLSARLSHHMAGVLLAIASVMFYSWEGWRSTPLLLASIAVNYGLAGRLHAWLVVGRQKAARACLVLGIAANLLTLGYFKYMNFFVDNFQQALGVSFEWIPIILPIGISFFTFTQIAFLVDAYQRKVGVVSPVHYLLFVTYFPHLIAGPILHHSEMMPQFRQARTYRPHVEAFAVGLTVFVIGLVKKVFVADSLAEYANYAFSPDHVKMLTMAQAWRGALAYTLQLYFDFSAYTDMAIGISRMLNIRLPANFDSPYKALSITDFWRRWHMTLSRFLRDYLYIPLGGNRLGPARRYVNLMVTMALGGLWRGAGWTFLIWGILHGSYLCANHAWSAATQRRPALRLPRVASWALTFTAVLVAWVFFRAPDLATALDMLRAMTGAGGNTDALPQAWDQGFGAVLRWATGDRAQFAWLAAGLAIVLALPNVQEIMDRHELVFSPAREPWSPARSLLPLRWKPDVMWAGLAVGLFALSLTQMDRISQFLYFQF